MKIVLLGEPMGLFMANEQGTLSEVRTFTSSIAGAEYNVAVGLARLGHTPVYCTRLGFDPMGEKILGGMCKNGISRKLVVQTDKALTGFMMKSSTDRGDPDIAYYRKNSAASLITPEDIDTLDLSNCERASFPLFQRMLLPQREDSLKERASSEYPIPLTRIFVPACGRVRSR